MTDANTAAYYYRREERERCLAAAAFNPAIAAIHLQMADRYGRLVASAPADPGPR